MLRQPPVSPDSPSSGTDRHIGAFVPLFSCVDDAGGTPSGHHRENSSGPYTHYVVGCATDGIRCGQREGQRFKEDVSKPTTAVARAGAIVIVEVNHRVECKDGAASSLTTRRVIGRYRLG